MKCIVVDDDPIFRELMAHYIATLPSLELVAAFSGSKDSIQTIKSADIDLVFLDIEMPDISGMEIVRELGNSTQVILVTSHEEFAVDAFSYRVTDYLVKPFTKERFNRAVSTAIEHHKQRSLLSEQEEIFVKIDSRFRKILCRDILSIQSDGDYVSIKTTTSSHLVSTSLNAMEDLLSRNNFLRVHRTNIVRLSAIDRIEKSNAILCDGSRIPISRAKKSELLQRLQT